MIKLSGFSCLEQKLKKFLISNEIGSNLRIDDFCVLSAGKRGIKIVNNIHIAPSAVLASSIKIESHVLVGMNSTIFYGIKIGESTTILNGLIINNNIDNDIIQKNNN